MNKRRRFKAKARRADVRRYGSIQHAKAVRAVQRGLEENLTPAGRERLRAFTDAVYADEAGRWLLDRQRFANYFVRHPESRP